MCTLVILRRPGESWPLLLAANRDEMGDRPWQPPDRHWPDRPEVVAGLDETAGGSWMGVNDHGLAAAILNRRGSLGPAPGKRSRGELVLEALDHAEAAEAAKALGSLNGEAYRSFNLVVGDAEKAFWLRNRGDGEMVETFPLPEGLSMLTAGDLNDPGSGRVRAHLPRFAAAPRPDPEAGDWLAWTALLSDRREVGGDPTAAMSVALPSGFQTVSSSLVALPAPPETLEEDPRRPLWLFCAGRPDPEGYWPVRALQKAGKGA